MNEILDIEVILKKQKYPFIYNIGVILIIILLIFIYISFIYNYKTYYISNGIVKDSCLELLVTLDDIKYVKENNIISIDNKSYKYNIQEISADTYVDNSYNNYKYILINVNNLNSINNYVYKIKIVKENKKIIEHLKDYF